MQQIYARFYSYDGSAPTIHLLPIVRFLMLPQHIPLVYLMILTMSRKQLNILYHAIYGIGSPNINWMASAGIYPKGLHNMYLQM